MTTSPRKLQRLKGFVDQPTKNSLIVSKCQIIGRFLGMILGQVLRSHFLEKRKKSQLKMLILKGLPIGPLKVHNLKSIKCKKSPLNHIDHPIQVENQKAKRVSGKAKAARVVLVAMSKYRGSSIRLWFAKRMNKMAYLQ